MHLEDQLRPHLLLLLLWCRLHLPSARLPLHLLLLLLWLWEVWNAAAAEVLLLPALCLLHCLP
jgi:hypothetical protein